MTTRMEKVAEDVALTALGKAGYEARRLSTSRRPKAHSKHYGQFQTAHVR